MKISSQEKKVARVLRENISLKVAFPKMQQKVSKITQSRSGAPRRVRNIPERGEKLIGHGKTNATLTHRTRAR